MVSAPSFATPSADIAAAEKAETAAIDASTRLPVLLLFGSAAAWLLVGSLLALVCSFKLHTPSFLGDCPWFTYGRVQPAQSNAFLYGWGVNAALGVALWLMARLSRATLRGCTIVFVATLFWNLAVALGIAGILTGDSVSLKWLEMPGYATPLLFAAYALIAVWAVVTFRAGHSRHIYVSQWYLLAALFWLPWIYSVAQVMVVFAPVRGTLQSLVGAWYVHNFFGLWLTPVALAASYYLLPKILGKPIHSYYLSSLAFWWLAFFSSFAGAALLLGGPVPAWVQAMGIAATLMLLVPAFIVGINLYGTLAGSLAAVKESTALRFVSVGVVAFSISILATVICSLRGVAVSTQFTFVTVAIEQVGLYGFFSMTMFGAIYHVLPRVTGREWTSPLLIRTHFAASVLGLLLLVLMLGLAGLKQGAAMNDAAVPFLDIVVMTRPYLLGATLAGFLLLVGHVAFALGVLGFLKPTRVPGASRSFVQTQVAAR